MLGLAGAFTLAVAAANASGTVTYVTQSEAFLNVGAQSGLAVGQKLEVTRKARKIGACDVVTVSDKTAICKGERFDRGDRFSFAVNDAVIPKPRPPDEVAKPRPPLPTASELKQKRDVVLAAPLKVVPFEKGEALATSARASVQLREQVWHITSSAGGPFARTSLDASAKASLGLGFLPTAYGAASMRVVGDLLAPADQRFRPGELVELYVWGASVGTSDGPVIAELGRFYPRMAPGLSLLDGAQVGGRFLGSTEVGVYAGVIPDVVSTLPAADRIAAGAYFGTDAAPLDDELLILPRLRVGVMSNPDFTVVRGEVEAQTQLVWINILTLGGSLRAGMGGTPQLAPSLDTARADLAFTAIPNVTLSGNYRFLAPLVVDYDLLSKYPVGAAGGAHHGGGSAAFRPFSWISLGATGGAGFDFTAQRARGYAGPEIGFPELFGSWGGMDVGYLEELGDWPGRSGWLSAHLAPLSVLRFGSRLSYFETQAFYDSLRETAVMLFVDAPVVPWLTLRGRTYVQQAMPTLAPLPRSTPTVVMADLSITGNL
jgi:hypothetical protein